VLVVVAAIGAFAARDRHLGALATGDAAKSERRALAPAQAAPIASPTRRLPAAIAARLPTPQLIAQLFVVGVRGTQPSYATLRAERRQRVGRRRPHPRQLVRRAPDPAPDRPPPARPTGCRCSWVPGRGFRA